MSDGITCDVCGDSYYECDGHRCPGSAPRDLAALTERIEALEEANVQLETDLAMLERDFVALLKLLLSQTTYHREAIGRLIRGHTDEPWEGGA